MSLHYYKDHLLFDKINISRHQQFMRETWPHFIGVYITSWLMFFLFKDNTDAMGNLLWLGVVHVLELISVVMYFIYFRNNHWISQKAWDHIVLLIALMWGLALALAPIIYAMDGSVVDVFIMCLIIVSLCNSPAPALVHYLIGFYLFITPPLLSMGVVVYSMPDDVPAVTHWLIPFMWLSFLGYGYSLYRSKLNLIILGLENEQANLTKSKFMATTSHDVRQPLQAMMMFLNTLKTKKNISNIDQDPTFLKIEQSVESVSDLLDNLLDISKLEADTTKVNSEHVALKPICEKIMDSYREQAQAKSLGFVGSLNDVVAWVDPILFQRVLMNLVSNAIRYSETGSVSVLLDADEKGVVVIVTDEGIGISEQNQKAIFADFFQVGSPASKSGEGLGLGLSIVRRLCDLQGWDIHLNSSLGLGTSISFTCPLGDVSQIKPMKAEMTVGDLSEVNVLLLEDDEAVRNSMLSMMDMWGCRKQGFESLEAVSAYLKSLDPIDMEKWPNLIVSDYRLGSQQKGTDALRVIAELMPPQHRYATLLITGDTQKSILQDIEQSGAMLMHKPIKPAQFRNCMKRLVDSLED